MYLKTKVAVICQGGDDPTVYRLALAAAAGAWDAGAEVRIRLVGEVTPPDDARPSPEWAEVLRDSEGIPPAHPDDLEWADVVLFGTPARGGTVLGSLKEFIKSAVPLRREGRLANKVYGVFTGLPIDRDRSETRLLSLADVFDLWGGTVVTPGGAHAPQPRTDIAPDRSARTTVVPTTTEAALAAARDQGRLAAVTAHRLMAARRALVDVA
jgi:NAD(P)H dehydrogenase (quinone)